VEAEWEQPPVFSARPRRRSGPTLEDRLIAHLLAPWLDRELARGLEEPVSEAHSARAEQLSGTHERRAVGRLLDRMVRRAEEPTWAFPRVFVAPCRDQVRHAMPVIASIRSRLRSTEPLDPHAIAQLKTLLRDRGGPCYISSRPDALKVALGEISAALDVRH